jgi:Ca2+-binding RTX toxin-like protein
VTYLDDGAGDDVVRVEARTTTVASLTAGADTFRGGSGVDFVVSGAAGERNSDRVHLGDGDDTTVLRGGRDHRRAVVDGGPGRDELALSVRRRGALSADADRQRARLAGTLFATWERFESYGLSSRGRQVFLGTEGDDFVALTGPGRADLLGGDDGVRVDAGSPRLPRVDGGPGEDTLAVDTTADVALGSLETDTVELRSSWWGTATLGFAGFEGLEVSASDISSTLSPPTRVELVGDEDANRLLGHACQVVIRGGAGDDELRVGSDSTPNSVRDGLHPDVALCAHTPEVYGEAGDDELVSAERWTGRRPDERPVADLLDGGEGTDSADAGKGIDTCLAEVRVGCER